MKKLTMRNVLTKEGYKALTAEERRYTLKIEQAKEYSGFRPYGTTCERILEQIPEDVLERYTARQIGEIMQVVNAAYQAGKKDVDTSSN